MSFYLACDGMSPVGRSLLEAYEDMFRRVMSDNIRSGKGQTAMGRLVKNTLRLAIETELRKGDDGDPLTKLAVIGAADYVNGGTATRDAESFVRENYFKFYDPSPRSPSKKKSNGTKATGRH